MTMLSRVDLLLLLVALPELSSLFPDALESSRVPFYGLRYTDLELLFPHVPSATWRVSVNRLAQEQCLHLREVGQKRTFLIAHEGKERVRSILAHTALRMPKDRWTLALLTSHADKPEWSDVKDLFSRNGWRALAKNIWVFPEWTTNQELRLQALQLGVRLECVPVRLTEIWPESWVGQASLQPTNQRVWQAAMKISERAQALLDDTKTEKEWTIAQSDRLGKSLVSGLSGIMSTRWTDSLVPGRVEEMQTLISTLQESLQMFIKRQNR